MYPFFERFIQKCVEMLIQALCSKASIFSFRHKIIAVNGLFSLMTHRKDFIPVLLPVILQYEVPFIAVFDACRSPTTRFASSSSATCSVF